MSKSVRHFVVLVWVVLLTLGSHLCVYGQSLHSDGDAASAQPPVTSTASPSPGWASDRFGMAAKVSLLGGGVEGAMRVTHRTNVRAGFNILSYSRGFNKDGVAYNGQLSFKTFEAHYDIFPFAGGFHVSPGLLAYIGDPISASAAVPANQSFTLGGTTYYSDPKSLIGGRGKINFNQAAPTVTVGWGNLVSRKEGKHFTVPFEIGVAFQGSPKANLNLTGNACDAPGVNCRSVLSDATIQSHILSEQTKINNSMSFFKVYPIISVGFGYKF